MRALTKYILWMLALLFAVLPIFLSIVILPNEFGRLVDSHRYDAKELILLCITVEVVALIDALEVLTMDKRRSNLRQKSAHALSVILLACVLLKLFGYSFWFAELQGTGRH